ncbi:MAG: polysaccharide biosynthesis/export family protein, partial [Muribaculaceae bacterium]|nr:polysaccharide biosynthesis/export family protein [Muribaculaceae bacterium]
MKKIILLWTVALMAALTSCNSSKKVLLMQDAEFNVPVEITNVNKIKVEPQDQISIVVSCKDPDIASLFNLITSQRLIYPGSQITNSSSTQLSIYTVDAEGNIDFPVVGQVNVAGLTRTQIAKKIKDLLVSEDLVKDPVVTVEFYNLHFSVMGEVTRPGTYNIEQDRITLLEALSMAGDMTIYGKRDKVYVIREKEGKRTMYALDLRSKDFMNSPVYYLQQNDVGYG